MPTNKYICDFCGCEWDDLKGAEECEAMHMGVEKAERIVPEFEPGDVFPEKLKIIWPYDSSKLNHGATINGFLTDRGAGQRVTIYYIASEEEPKIEDNDGEED